MTLWVFGDSYAEHYSSLNDQWMTSVANVLNTDLKCFGLVGSSTEFTFNSFLNVRNQIKKNDIIIILLTTHSRRWFFKLYPSHTANPQIGTDYKNPVSVYEPTGFNDIDDALKLYEEFLNNQSVFESYLENFLYSLDYLTKKLNCHTIIIPNFYDTGYFLKDKKELFPNLSFAKGMMVDISLNEFTKDYLIEYTTSTKDLRVNHLMKYNHNVLGNKILNNIQNKIEIDLTMDFIKHIINKDKIMDNEFIKDELFNGILK
jgi:hypothetical protein